MSAIAWLDHTEADKPRMLAVIDLFREQDTVDELGLSAVWDVFADLLFPGTGTECVATRATPFARTSPLRIERRVRGRNRSLGCPVRRSGRCTRTLDERPRAVLGLPRRPPHRTNRAEPAVEPGSRSARCPQAKRRCLPPRARPAPTGRPSSMARVALLGDELRELQEELRIDVSPPPVSI